MTSPTLNIASYTDPNVLGSFQDALGSVGVDASSVAAAQSAYGMLPASAQSAVGQVLNGFNALPPQVKEAGGDIIGGALHGTVPLTAMMPLVSLGLAATGVGAPVAGLIAAAVPIAESIGEALHLFGSPVPNSHCDWIIQGTAVPSSGNPSGGDMQVDTKFHGLPFYGCFKGKRPFGPTDPIWVKWPDYVKKYQDNNAGNGTTHAIGAFPEWTKVYSDLRDSANYGNKNYSYKTTDGKTWKAVSGNAGNGQFKAGPLWTASQSVRDFATLYFYMWQANAELAINGHKFASDANILTAAIQAWNLHHKGGGTFTILPKSATGGLVPGTYLGPGAWFVESLLNGDVDGQDYPPIGGTIGITLPTGIAPRIAVPPTTVPIHIGIGVASQPPKPTVSEAQVQQAGRDAAAAYAKLHGPPPPSPVKSYHPAIILGGVGAAGILGFVIGGPVGAAVGSVVATVVGNEYKKKATTTPNVSGDVPSFAAMAVRTSGNAKDPHVYPKEAPSKASLLATSKEVAKIDTLVRAGRRVVPSSARDGYDVATGLLSYRQVPTAAYEGIRASLSAVDRKGFDMASALRLGQARNPTPPKLLDTPNKRAGYYLAMGAKDLGVHERASVMRSVHGNPEHSTGAQAAHG